jgi:NAD(P)-dependent dehydrogenase (short-subunit alcohol dehydrogenase family)
MRVTVLGATGGTGRHLVTQALERGHQVGAVVRDPGHAALPAHPHLTVYRGDVHDAASIADAIAPGSVVVSGLGVTSKKEVGTLTAGARAVVAAHPARIVWLGAIGTGRSASAVGRLTARLLRAGFGAEYDDKVTADAAVLDAGGTVLHSGPLSDQADDPGTRALPVSAAGRRFFPHRTSRATIARLMLDEAETPKHPGQLIIPQRRRSGEFRRDTAGRERVPAVRRR